MEDFDKRIYFGLMVAGKPREAVAYLGNYPEKRSLARRIEKRMNSSLPLRRSSDPYIQQVDGAYQEYYRDIFWRETSREKASSVLARRLAALLNQAPAEEPDKLEEALAKEVEGRGFYFLGGLTQGYYGPYIWKTTTPAVYTVELPMGVQEFTVQMMDGFVSRSWLDFISLGKFGTGGWQSDTQLFCVYDSYKSDFEKPSFQISFLKHEAQHVYDRNHYPGISSMELEYRAKLVELIYFPRLSLFLTFLAQADDSNPKNTHNYAARRIVENLSRRVFHEKAVTEPTRWKGKLSAVRRESQWLYNVWTPGNVCV